MSRRWCPVTRLRWSDDGTEWHPAASDLPAGALVHGLALLEDSRVLAVGSLPAPGGRQIPLVGVGAGGGGGAVQWEGYRADPGQDVVGTVNLLGAADAGSEVLAVGGLSTGERDDWTAAVWGIQLRPPPSGGVG